MILIQNMAIDNKLILILQTVELNYRGSEITVKMKISHKISFQRGKKFQIITTEPGKKCKFL